MSLYRLLLPVVVFTSVLAAHVAWFTNFGPQATWLTLEETPSALALTPYLETQSYWLGFSYAVGLAFAATAFRRYHEEAYCGARTLAIGGVTLTGFFAIAGCYVLGCCGSPMLAVYASLFGAHFLSTTKPLVAAITVLSVAVAWWRMNRGRSTSVRGGTTLCAADCESDRSNRSAGASQ